MTQELEAKLKEDDAIKHIDDELGSPIKPPLTGGHIPFGEMGITPSLEERVMDVYNVLFDHLKKRIVQESLIFFLNDP